MHTILTALLGVVFEPNVAMLVVLAGDILAIATIPSVLLRRRGRPMAALSWLLALLIVPYVGVLLWWILGRTHLARQRRKRKRALELLCEACPPLATVPESLPESLRRTLPFALAGRRWCFINSRDFNQCVSEVLSRDMESSTELRSEDLEGASTRQILCESAAHLLSPLL